MTVQERYAAERTRLLAGLGEIVDGGIVENAQHIGATRILGDGEIGDGDSTTAVAIDIALALIPLDDSLDAKLHALGYTAQGEIRKASVKLFRHATGAFQVWAIEAGDDAWMEWVVLSDFLLHNAGARNEYAAAHQAWQTDTEQKSAYFRDVWAQVQPWWIEFYGFDPVRKLAQELAGLDAPWYLAGGWAIDLFLNKVRRVHHDVDVVIARTDHLQLHPYLTERGWKFVTPFEGRLEPWGPHLRLELPRHQAHAHRAGEFIDFQITEIENGVWTYRREPSIVQSIERVTMKNAEGIPFMAPTVPLLFKSRNTSANGKERRKDETDFENALPHLNAEQRAWLKWALLVTSPEHPWLERLN